MDQASFGFELKEDGMAQVLSHNLGWKAMALVTLRKWLSTLDAHAEFTIDDFRWANRYMEEPRHYKAWGAFWNVAAKHKIILPTGRYRNSPAPSRHAAPNQIWTKGI